MTRQTIVFDEMLINFCDRDEVITSIAYSLLIPNLLFILSLVVLVYWYCPYCQAKCKNYQQADLDDK